MIVLWWAPCGANVGNKLPMGCKLAGRRLSGLCDRIMEWDTLLVGSYPLIHRAGAGVLVSMTVKSNAGPSVFDNIFLMGFGEQFRGGLARLLDLSF